MGEISILLTEMVRTANKEKVVRYSFSDMMLLLRAETVIDSTENMSGRKVSGEWCNNGN